MTTPLILLVLSALGPWACMDHEPSAAADEPVAALAPASEPGVPRASAPAASTPDESASPGRDSDRQASSERAPDPGIHARFDALLRAHVSNGVVDYAGLAQDRGQLDAYRASLERTDPARLDHDARMAFWINAYNAFTLELILREYPEIESIKDIPSSRRWDGDLWTVAGKRYSLDEIEHEILRPMGDARIHFAIVCASISCPSLASQAYLPQTLDAQLDAAGAAFLADRRKGLDFGDEKGFFGTNHVVRLSPILDWFEEDFERDGTLLDFVLRFAPEDAAAYIRTYRDDLDVEFLDYDWNLNGR